MRLLRITYQRHVDDGVARLRRPEVHPAPVDADLVLAEAVHVEDGVGARVGVEGGAEAEAGGAEVAPEGRVVRRAAGVVTA